MSGEEGRILELERRLAEAEETLRAIRQGDVDAVVIGGPLQEQVITFDGGVESFSAFMETMDPGAAAVDVGGQVLYANTALSLFLGISRERLIGCPLAAGFDGRAAATIADLLRRGADGSRQYAEIVLSQGTQQITLHVSLAPLVIGQLSGFAVTFTDMSDRVRALQATEAAIVARAVIASANEAVIVCDRTGTVTHVNAATRALHDGDIVGRRLGDSVPLVFPGRPAANRRPPPHGNRRNGRSGHRGPGAERAAVEGLSRERGAASRR